MAEKLKATGAKERKGNAPKQQQIPGTENTEEMVGDITMSMFKKLELKIKNATQSKDDGQMSLASAAKEFKDAGGHYEMLKLVTKWDRMADDKLSETLRHLDAYIDYMGLRRRTSDLFEDDEAVKAQTKKPLDQAKTDSQKGAYEEGRAACGFGNPKDDNPYADEFAEHDDWNRGWTAVFEEGGKGMLKKGGGEHAESNVTHLASQKSGGDSTAAAKV